MKWWERLWRAPARKYLLIGILSAFGLGAPVAISVGTGIDDAVQDIIGGDSGDEA